MKSTSLVRIELRPNDSKSDHLTLRQSNLEKKYKSLRYKIIFVCIFLQGFAKLSLLE